MPAAIDARRWCAVAGQNLILLCMNGVDEQEEQIGRGENASNVAQSNQPGVLGILEQGDMQYSCIQFSS